MSQDKILLIRMNLTGRKAIKQPFHSTPPFYLKYIQSLLQDDKRITVRLLDAFAQDRSYKEILEEIKNWKPQFLVIFINVVTFQEFRKFILALVQDMSITPQPFKIAVGQLIPDDDLDVKDQLDVFLPGEGEEETCAIIKRILSNQSTRKTEIKRYQKYKARSQDIFITEDLDRLPFPTYSQDELRDYHFLYPIQTDQALIWGHILSSRGCPYGCLFCSPVMRESYGDRLRLRNPIKVVDEMESLMKQGVNIISFDDDNFTTSSQYVIAVCQEIIQRGLKIKWIIHARIDNVDFELLNLLKTAGCVHIRFGIESGSETVIKALHKKQTDIQWGEQTEKIFAMTKKLDIATTGLFVVGNPKETYGDIQLTIQLAKKILPDVVQVHFFTPYPGSKIYDHMDTRSDDGASQNMFHYNLPTLNISKMSAKEMQRARTQLYRSVLWNPYFLFTHILKYYKFYFHNSHILRKLIKAYFL